jgi:hypothetical protein
MLLFCAKVSDREREREKIKPDGKNLKHCSLLI